MCVHAWFHAVFCVENSIITYGNKILHMTRRGISFGIYTRVYMICVIYTARLLALEASYIYNPWVNMISSIISE